MNNIKANLTRLIALLLIVVMSFSIVGCDKLPFDLESIFGNKQDVTPECKHETVIDGICDYCKKIVPITIAEAIEICKQNPSGSSEKYYIRATVKTIVNASFGEMYIEDETGEIYVYGVRDKDWKTYFDQIPETPVKGDEVLLLCQLGQHNEKNEVNLAALIEFKRAEVDLGDIASYTEMSIADAREKAAGTPVRVKGVVAQIAYANGKVPCGVILVDETSSIYVYSNDLAGQVSVGNTVEIAASKAYWILADEANNASKFGYKGSNQLENVIVISNDKGNTEFNKSWINETTVKDIMDTPATEDITNKIFKVNALVNKVPGNGYLNYYFNDIDGVTGSYTYTQCNGKDFEWLDKFDGQICTVYIVAINAKSSGTGCIWRFLPIAVSDDGYTFDLTNTAEYAVKYHGVTQFLDRYTGDPALELATTVSSELLGFENASLSYSSSNEEIISFTEVDGKQVMHCSGNGKVTVTVKATYNGNEYSESVEIAVIPNIEIDTITVADAIAKELNEEVVVRGIVGPSVVNQQAFYLFDESGMVAVRVADSAIFETIAIGNEVVIKGKRDMWHGNGKDYGQIVISNATVEANYYGKNDYLTITPITDKTIEYFYNLDELDMSESTKLYVLTGTVVVKDGTYSSTIHLSDGTKEITLYSSSANQYGWLKEYAGQTVTVEIAPCNWNSKTYYAGCVLALIKEDGSKILNTLNFK